MSGGLNSGASGARLGDGLAGLRAVALGLGYTFLYLPIVVVIVYSFNDSRLVTVWGGFSTRWFGELLHDDKMLSAAALSLQIAAISATLATIIGTAAAIALHRGGRFPGRSTLDGMLTSLLVVPDIVLGLAFLLLFVVMGSLIGWPAGRGALTVTIAHTTLAVAYATLVVRAKLTGVDPDLLAAAADLGETPMRAHWRVTLPLIAPALAVAWLLSFTLSLDDVVLASFVSGPGSSTLPMVVFSSVRLGLSPEVNALATLLLAAVATVTTTAAIWTLRRAKRQA
jgi:putrescine transport system permease protein